ncbi:protein kinase domain-containing protein [Actinoalloteichus caeruleus]|uniref:protein kinase domain-containing protein n=1 Tax=Actinoalloteichus cyanogriseus TaxID=2893586 RepID=UPI003BB9941E
MSDEGRLVAGRYRLEKRIGSGAMGVVWKGADERLGRVIAIKQLLPQGGLSPSEAEEARQRAMREGRIAARLQHQNAIAVYDVAEDSEGQPCLIMEYLPSSSLAAVLSEQGTLPPREVARIGEQVAAALAAAHAAGIVHRDIKPGNILLGEHGVVKITDFGISRATGDVTVTKTGMLAGTPAYLAPEVAKGYDPGFAADVFSLGATLYAAVEGEPPFGVHENTLALLHMVAAGRVNPPRHAGPLTALMMRLLRAEPIERPTMAQVREGLHAVATGQPVPATAMPPSPPGATTGNGGPARPPGPIAAAATTPVPPANGQQGPRPEPLRPASRPEPTRVGPNPFADDPPPPAQHAPHGGPPRDRAHQAHQARSGPPHAPSNQGAAPPQEVTSRRRAMALTGIAVVAAALIGVLLASVIFDNSGDSIDAGTGGRLTGAETSLEVSDTSERAEPEAPPETTEETTTEETTPEPPPTTEAERVEETEEQEDPEDTAERYEDAAEDYYDMLPDDVEDAWLLLAPSAQNDPESYRNWWGSVEDVDVRGNPRYNGDGTVDIKVRYEMKEDGRRSNETVRLYFEEIDGRLLIADSHPV